MKKILLILALVVAALVAVFFVLNAYIYQQKQGDGNTYEPYRATLNGEYVCLPHVDQSIPHTDECVPGIKTDEGQFFAVDFALMSQIQVEMEAGQRFSAGGVVTPIERLSTDHWRKYPVVGIFSVTDSVVTEKGSEEMYECDADAMMCPDGSSVGRQGPNCEFATCPSPTATSARVTTYLDGTATALTVSVNPREIVSDSRCPANENVQCIWEGTVEVRTAIATPVSHGEHVFSLGSTQIFGDYTVTLVDVTPAKTVEGIPDSSYRFTFEIQKR